MSNDFDEELRRNYSRCMFCSDWVPNNLRTAHVTKVCIAHPMRALETERDSLLEKLKEEMSSSFAVSAQLSQERAEFEATIKDLRAKLEQRNELLYDKLFRRTKNGWDGVMKYVIKKSPDSTDSLSWWNCESRNWDIRSKATILSFHQGQHFVLDLHATRVGPNAFLVPADESPAPTDNIPPPADKDPPPADKAASPTKDQTMRIDLGIRLYALDDSGQMWIFTNGPHMDSDDK
jgi:hypothetical protein